MPLVRLPPDVFQNLPLFPLFRFHSGPISGIAVVAPKEKPRLLQEGAPVEGGLEA